MPATVGVLLAAGLGARYDPTGECLKLLQPTVTGKHAGAAIVAAAARNLRSATSSTMAVVRPRTDPHQRALHDLLVSEGCELVICELAADGMGVSLACGIGASARSEGWIVALGDMPAIEPSTIQAVAAALRAGHPTAAPVYRGQRGHPVGFSPVCLSDLLHTKGDHGARGVLEKFPPYLIDVDDMGVVIDIDQR